MSSAQERVLAMARLYIEQAEQFAGSSAAAHPDLVEICKELVTKSTELEDAQLLFTALHVRKPQRAWICRLGSGYHVARGKPWQIQVMRVLDVEYLGEMELFYVGEGSDGQPRLTTEAREALKGVCACS